MALLGRRRREEVMNWTFWLIVLGMWLACEHKNAAFWCPDFVSYVKDNFAVGDKESHVLIVDISRFRITTFLVVNKGSRSVICQMKMSPDGNNWHNLDGIEYVVLPGQMQALVPQYFLQFVQISCKSAEAGGSSVVDVWFQGQR